MNAKVMKSFRDKITKKVNAAGDVITVTDERFNEINAHKNGPFLEDVAAAEKAAKEAAEAAEAEAKAAAEKAAKADKKTPAKKED